MEIFLHPRMLEALDLRQRRVGNNFLVGQHRDAITNSVKRVEIVCDDEHGQAQGFAQGEDELVECGGTDRVEAGGRFIQEQQRRIERHTGVLFQDGALVSSLTVGENVEVPLKEHHPELCDALRYELALLKVKLSGLPADAMDKLPSQLSGGMRKRAGLARALALDPPLLFLDEPTAGLDPIGAAAFDELILALREALGLTVFIITHDLDTLYAICDRVAVLADKKVIINAPLAEVEQCQQPWIQAYFHGPRARAAQVAATDERRMIKD